MNRLLRFIVADPQELNRIHVERILNSLGCFRVVPVATFEEVEVLNHCTIEPFDGLIMNFGLMPPFTVRRLGFTSIHSILVYDQPGASTCPIHWEAPRGYLHTSSTPGRDLLARWFGA